MGKIPSFGSIISFIEAPSATDSVICPVGSDVQIFPASIALLGSLGGRG